MTEREGRPLLRMTEGGRAAPQNDSSIVILCTHPLPFCASTTPVILRFHPGHSALPPTVILRLHYPCHSAPPPLSFCASTPCHSAPTPPHCHSEPPLPLVILSEAKNLSSWLRGMVQKILRSEAPQNDRERGRAAPQNDSIPPFVILSEAKNLFSRLKW